MKVVPAESIAALPKHEAPLRLHFAGETNVLSHHSRDLGIAA